MKKSTKKGAISLMVMLIGLALLAAVAGLVVWKFDSFRTLLGERFGGVTTEVKNDTVEKSKSTFCKNVCKTCCHIKDEDTDCQHRMELQKVEVGEKEVPCSEIIDCNC